MQSQNFSLIHRSIITFFIYLRFDYSLFCIFISSQLW